MKIAIIGAGAAGMMCAAELAEKSTHEVHLFDKNEKPGLKVTYTGGGRCNITTSINDKKLLMKKYTRGAEFLSNALSVFSPASAVEWFESHGLPLKVEANNRVFPVSDNSFDVIEVFTRIFEKYRVKLHFSEPVENIKVDDAKFVVKTAGSEYEFDRVVITTGGNTFPQTGSTGDGYNFAERLGHKVTKLAYSLNSFNVAENWCKELSGLSFQNASLKFSVGEKQIVTVGPVLFTHYGISGPNTFEMASHLAYEEISSVARKTVYLKPFSSLMFNDWNEKLLKSIEESGAKQIISILNTFLPEKFAVKLLQTAVIDLHKKAAVLTKQERNSLVHLLGDGIPITLISKSAGNEFVTAGGVELSEIDSRTMQSKLTKGLYYAGEVLNIDGVTGGFNLQAAWSTGYIVARDLCNNF